MLDIVVALVKWQTITFFIDVLAKSMLILVWVAGQMRRLPF